LQLQLQLHLILFLLLLFWSKPADKNTGRHSKN
jgi:hypothetical protein